MLNKKRFWLGAFLVLFAIICGTVFASLPSKMSYEGRLTDASGTAITSAKTVVFKIYNAETSGTLLWGPESQSVTPDSQGVFSVLLGSASALSPQVFSGASTYLEISVGGETLSPRTRIVSVGYAFKAATAATAESVVDGAITRSKAAAGNFVKQIIAGSGISVSGDEGSGTGAVTLTATGTGGGTVVAVNTGTGLTGGPITSTGTLSIDATTVVTTTDAQTLTNKTLSTGSLWSGDKISEVYGGTNQNAYTKGDLLYASGTNVLSRLGTGADGKVLKITSGIPSWETVSGAGTVTQVNTGAGLTGGPITGTGTIAIDSTVVTAESTHTLKNKTISGSDNLLSNLNADNISSGTLNADRIPGLSASKITSGTFSGDRIAANINITTTGSISAASVVGAHYGDGSALTGIIGQRGPTGETGATGPTGESGTSSWADGAGKVTTNVLVGIGSTEPGSKLTVAGTIEMTAGSGGGIKFPDTSIQTTAYTGATNLQGDNSSITIESDVIKIKTGGVTTELLASGIDAAKLADGSVSNAEFQYLGNVTSDIQTQLNAKGTGSGTVTQVNTGEGLTGGPITSTGMISIDASVVTLTKTQTLTNKTISDANNTITLSSGSIPDLDASKITTGTLAVASGGTGTSTGSITGTGNLAFKPGADSTTAIQLQNAAGTSILNVDSSSSNVGIGITAPTSKLHVYRSDTSTASREGIIAVEAYYSGGTTLSKNKALSAKAKATGPVAGNSAVYSEAVNAGSGAMTNNMGFLTNAYSTSTGSITFNTGLFSEAYKSSGAGTIDYNAGLWSNAYTAGSSGTITYNTGLFARAFLYPSSTGNATNNYGGWFYGSVIPSSASGTITNAYGVLIEQPYKSGAGGTLTNAHALRITGVSTGAATAKALYIDSPHDNYIAGKVGIGSSEPSSSLTVAGTIEMTSSSGGQIKFADGTLQNTAFTGAGGVTSFASQEGSRLTGAVDLKPGSNVTITQTGQTIEVAAASTDITGKVSKAGDTMTGALVVNNQVSSTLSSDIASGDAYSFSGAAVGELTSSSTEQAFFKLNPHINQSGTAGYVGLLIDSTLTGYGSGSLLMFDYRVGGTTRFKANTNYTGSSIQNRVNAGTDGQVAYFMDEKGIAGLIIQSHFLQDQALIYLGSKVGTQLNLGASTNDYDHANQTNPTLFMHSALNPNTSNNQWGSLAHNQTGFVITTGAATGAGTAPTTIDNYISFAPRNVEAMRITGEGSVGIGTTEPTSRLTVAGTIEITAGDLKIANLQTSGSSANVYYDADTDFFYLSTSSRKYKEDIQRLKTDFSGILGIEPKSFTDKSTRKREIGFIAEEFDAAGLKELVVYKDGQPDALKYDRIPLYLLEVMKEQQTRIKSQQEQIEELREQVGLLIEKNK